MSELPIKLTTKAGAGYDAPWLTVDAATPDDLAFKAKALIEHPEALQAAIELANTLKAINSAAPILAPVADAPPTSQPAPQQPAQQGWGVANRPSDGGSQGPTSSYQNSSHQTPAAQQQHAAPPQQNRYNDVPHPEGKTCTACPEVLVKKKSQGGKEKWQCPAWRWNNGNPNGHAMEWIG